MDDSNYVIKAERGERGKAKAASNMGAATPDKPCQIPQESNLARV
jgi:hypothetical protein